MKCGVEIRIGAGAVGVRSCGLPLSKLPIRNRAPGEGAIRAATEIETVIAGQIGQRGVVVLQKPLLTIAKENVVFDGVVDGGIRLGIDLKHEPDNRIVVDVMGTGGACRCRCGVDALVVGGCGSVSDKKIVVNGASRAIAIALNSIRTKDKAGGTA